MSEYDVVIAGAGHNSLVTDRPMTLEKRDDEASAVRIFG